MRARVDPAICNHQQARPRHVRAQCHLSKLSTTCQMGSIGPIGQPLETRTKNLKCRFWSALPWPHSPDLLLKTSPQSAKSIFVKLRCSI